MRKSPLRAKYDSGSISSHRSDTSTRGISYRGVSDGASMVLNAPSLERKVYYMLVEYLSHHAFTSTIQALEKDFKSKYDTSNKSLDERSKIKEAEMNYFNSMDVQGIKVCVVSLPHLLPTRTILPLL